MKSNPSSLRMVHWAIGGATVGFVLSLGSIYLPPELGGYVDWSRPGLALHNVAAILTRVVIFAAIGAALAGRLHYHRHKRRR